MTNGIPKALKKMRHCFYCGAELGCYADYDPLATTCGARECGRTTAMADDVVTELDAEIALWEPLPYRVPIHLLARRARDEIVWLREMREAEFRMLSTNRDEVLEVAARECDEEAKASSEGFRDGCETCAAAIRALREKHDAGR